jgi:hypothetical protein
MTRTITAKSNERLIRRLDKALDKAYKDTFREDTHFIIDHIRRVIERIEYDIRVDNYPTEDIPQIISMQLDDTLDDFRQELKRIEVLLQAELTHG